MPKRQETQTLGHARTDFRPLGKAPADMLKIVDEGLCDAQAGVFGLVVGGVVEFGLCRF